MPPEMLSLFPSDTFGRPAAPAGPPMPPPPSDDDAPFDSELDIELEFRDVDDGDVLGETEMVAPTVVARSVASDPGPIPHADPARIPPGLLDGLNPEQRDAASTLTGPLLVIAGPGSGKTAVLTRRLAALLACGVPAWRILAVTFTNKASKEMRERLDGLAGPDASSVWVSTFHSLCVRILRANHDAVNLTRNFTIVDADDAKRLVARAAERVGFGKLESKELRDIVSSISRAKNQGKTAADLEEEGEGPLAELFVAYQTVMAESGGVDFDDLLLLTRDLLATDPAVARYYQRRFAYISVDEFQDTNPVQNDILTSLAAGHSNLMVVGDADQAVYGFRSATPSIMLRFPQVWSHTHIVKLGRNYRSTKAILETVNAIIADNPSDLRALLTTDNPAGDPVRFHHANDDRDEAAFILRGVLDSGTPLGQHAVLVRTHAQTRSLEEACTRQAVPYDIVGALKFYDRKEVRDALAWLKVALNPRDTISFVRAAGSPKRGLGAKTLDELVRGSAEAGRPVVDHARTAAVAGARGQVVSGFVGLIDDARAFAGRSGPGAALEFITDATGMRDAYRKDEQSETRLENLDEIVAAGRRFTEDGSVTAEGVPVATLDGIDATAAFLEHVSLVTADDADPKASPASRLQIITAHASKGKEFPHVWVAGVEDGFYPHTRSTTRAEVAEERRLLFVAASRAESQLTLTATRRRAVFGRSPEDRLPSPFLSSLPASVVMTEDRPTTPSYGGGYGGRNTYRGGSRSGARRQPAPQRRTAPPAAPTSIATRRARPGPAPKAVLPVLEVGGKVEHATFGRGTVLDVDGDTAEIAFARVGTKSMDLRYAPLTTAA